MLPELNYAATVHNGIRMDGFPFEPQKEDYLLFAGRLSPEKGPDVAIEIAKKSGRRLLMAGLIEGQYQEFFDERVKPHIDGRTVDYLGLLSQEELEPAVFIKRHLRLDGGHTDGVFSARKRTPADENSMESGQSAASSNGSSSSARSR